jgi:hypothetical protein
MSAYVNPWDDRRHWALDQTRLVRVIEYAQPRSNTIYRLLTSMLDPVMAPAHELAALYAERWGSGGIASAPASPAASSP